MKYFFDTEFIEGVQMNNNKPTIDLISIGIFSEEEDSYYAVSKDFNLFEAWNRYDIKEGVKEYWIRDNVLKKIFDENSNGEFNFETMTAIIRKIGKSNTQIAKEIKDFVKSPEFYGYYADYDWVVFCWLFGRMIDLPKGFPMYCRDLKQMFDEKGLSKKSDKYPKQDVEHNALADAKWNYELYKYIQNDI